MIRITTLDSKSSEIQIKFAKAGDTTLTITNVYGHDVITLPLFTYNSGVGKFRLTDDVHMLPFGRYVGQVITGNCFCGCFPIDIPECSIEDIVVEDIKNDDCAERPVRECAQDVCECECECECECDECTGCSECNPCDVCHPCYDDRLNSINGYDYEQVESIVIEGLTERVPDVEEPVIEGLTERVPDVEEPVIVRGLGQRVPEIKESVIVKGLGQREPEVKKPSRPVFEHIVPLRQEYPVKPKSNEKGIKSNTGVKYIYSEEVEKALNE